jgi:hypothetical protein
MDQPPKASSAPVIDYRSSKEPPPRPSSLGPILRGLAGLTICVVALAGAIALSASVRRPYTIVVFPVIVLGLAAVVWIVYRLPIWIAGILLALMGVYVVTVLWWG